MLVCVREVDKAELTARLPRHHAAAHFERFYSLYTNTTTATIVDVVDSRARKTFNYDVALHSADDVRQQVIQPLLTTVLTPDRAAQAVVVVDGTAGNRRATLMDANDGVLAATARAAAAHPDVASLAFSAVTLEDHNTFSDILLPDGIGGAGGAAEVTVLEDTEEQFTSIEDAHYVPLDSERTWTAVLQRVSQGFADYKHQVFSFIFSFHPSTGRPNTTLQVLSFTVSEVARGMKSSRHAVSSAAGLIECRSPTLTFTTTKLLYLLKPVLLGQQPGAWLACFSPVSSGEGRETFQEAFAVAQTASRLHSSRIALLGASPTLPPAVEDKREDEANAVPFVDAPPPPPPPRAAAATPSAQTDSSFSRDGSASHREVYESRSHLVSTPAGAGATQRVEAGTSTPRQQHQQQPQIPQRSIKMGSGVQTQAAAPSAPSVQTRESIQRAASEDTAAVRYEFDTYRAVMERALATLRADVQRYTEQMEEMREEMRTQRRQSRELRRELERADESHHATVLENSDLRRQLEGQQRRYEQKVQELSQLSAASSMLQQQQQQQTQPPPSGVLARQEEDREAADATTRALRDDVALLEVRVAELTELVAFHQSEIKGHVSQEHRYRQRILDLEAALREKEREVIARGAAVQDARRTAEQQPITEPPVPHHTAEPPLSHSRTSSAVLRADFHDVENRAEEVECHLRSAMDELQRERTQRMQLEHLLKQREAEDMVRASEQEKASLVQDLRHTYTSQLRELRDDMEDFRTQLAQQVVRSASPPAAAVVGAESSAQGQQQQQPPSRPPIPVQMSPALDSSTVAAAVDTSRTDGSTAPHGSGGASAVRSQRTSAQPSPARPRRLTQSFEEYMKEEPHFELHRASFLRPRSRPPGADTSVSSTQ